MASSSGPDFVISSGCSHCSKIDMKEFPCPSLAGRGRNLYNNLSGLPIHPQLINRSSCQCCPGPHQQLCPSIPIRLNSFCSCPRCRRTQQADTIDRRVPFPHNPHFVPCNSNWVNPVEVQNTGYIPPTLQNQANVLGHVGMASFNPVDNVQVNGMSPLSYHHHHHYHHYHYHPHTHSRNTLNPYPLPVLHPRLRRQPNLRHISRRNAEEEQVPHSIFSILTPGRVTWDTALDAEQLESVVNFGEQLVDQKPRGLSKTIVENLPSYRITAKDKNIGESRCVICLMDFEEKHQVRILPCLHEYHTKCIDKWLKSNRTCPICRKEIKIS